MQMAALELKLQTEAVEKERRMREEEELTGRRLMLERIHQVQLQKEAELEKERRELAHAWQELNRQKGELSRREKELDEGLKGFALSLAQLGAPKID